MRDDTTNPAIDIEDLLKYHDGVASSSPYSPCFINPTRRTHTAIALRLLLAEVRAWRERDREMKLDRAMPYPWPKLIEARAATDAQIKGVRP